LLIRGEDEQSYIKITVDKEDFMGVRFTVDAQSKGFSVSVGGIYIVTDHITDFVSTFRTLENKRSGEASLHSASPEAFELSLRIIDSKGHVLSSLRMKHLSYYEKLVIPCSSEICFGIDPTTLPNLLNQFESLERDARRFTSNSTDPFLN
jgi:hypothetical protein